MDAMDYDDMGYFCLFFFFWYRFVCCYLCQVIDLCGT
jgi:hypothetical protein